MSQDYDFKDSLDVYLFNKRIGVLKRYQRRLEFSYQDSYLQDSNATQLSSQFPLNQKSFEHEVTHNFFSALLPDEYVREFLAKHLQISVTNTFELLKIVGGECAGAVSLYPKNKKKFLKKTNHYRVLTDREAAKILESLEQRPFLADDGDIRMSVAGAQNKLLISFKDNKVAIPLYNSVSTHIVKTEIKGFEETVCNEYFCMRLAQEIGFNVPEINIFELNKKSYYLISRYDRIHDSEGNYSRLHQEDFCQILSFPPETKYEREGGPTLNQCFNLLKNKISLGRMQGMTFIDFIDLVIFNFIIGNGDAHAKNFSILYKAKEESLAPCYDLLSTKVYANPHKSKMAMKLGGEYKFKNISFRNFEKLAIENDLKVSLVQRRINYLKDRITSITSELISRLENQDIFRSPIYRKIEKVIKSNLKQI